MIKLLLILCISFASFNGADAFSKNPPIADAKLPFRSTTQEKENSQLITCLKDQILKSAPPKLNLKQIDDLTGPDVGEEDIVYLIKSNLQNSQLWLIFVSLQGYWDLSAFGELMTPEMNSVAIVKNTQDRKLFSVNLAPCKDLFKHE